MSVAFDGAGMELVCTGETNSRPTRATIPIQSEGRQDRERERERESVSSKTNCQLVGVVDFYANTVDTVGPEGLLVLSIPAEFVISADLMEMLRETLRMCEYAKILRIRFSRREYRVVTACSYRENLIFLCHIDQVSFQLLKY